MITISWLQFPNWLITKLYTKFNAVYMDLESCRKPFPPCQRLRFHPLDADRMQGCDYEIRQGKNNVALLQTFGLALPNLVKRPLPAAKSKAYLRSCAGISVALARESVKLQYCSVMQAT